MHWLINMSLFLFLSGTLPAQIYYSEVVPVGSSNNNLDTRIDSIQTYIDTLNVIVAVGADMYVKTANDSLVFMYQPRQVLEFSSLVTSTTTAGLTAINQDINFPSSGKYIIEIAGKANSDSNTSDGIVEVQFAGENFDPNSVEVFRAERKDSAGNDPAGSASSQKETWATVQKKELVAGNYNLTLTVRSEVGGVEASVWSIVVKITKYADL